MRICERLSVSCGRLATRSWQSPVIQSAWCRCKTSQPVSKHPTRSIEGATPLQDPANRPPGCSSCTASTLGTVAHHRSFDDVTVHTRQRTHPALPSVPGYHTTALGPGLVGAPGAVPAPFARHSILPATSLAGSPPGGAPPPIPPVQGHIIYCINLLFYCSLTSSPAPKCLLPPHTAPSPRCTRRCPPGGGIGFVVRAGSGFRLRLGRGGVGLPRDTRVR